MADELDWQLCRSFLAVLDEGSLSGAARALGLTQPTIGRHIEALEQALATPLFVRSPQGLVPTEAALEIRPHAEAMRAAAASLRRAISGAEGGARGTVRLTASEVVGAEVLPPMLARLRERHPGISLELVLSNRTQDLLKRESDIAIRMIRPTQSALLSRKVGVTTLGLHAHRDYLARHGTPRSLDELDGHVLIGFDKESPSIQTLRAMGFQMGREAFALRTDSDLAQLALIRAGAGIGVCQVGVARREETLVHVLPEDFVYSLDLWVVMHENLQTSERMRLVYDHLATELKAYALTSRR
ncbi:LysR family transcriptional regulator [Cystobacter ferrugineus]|uniref:LysR family transcriptional regulator n=1 Tax=Cystobacter ferrugineus TaxID=83449 RepID=A0A1L9B200_9BACT|nr:LysR family transcriptional regulator [Cystobacter ferrugineus]OJH36213.1 LysR family transcriptional regulator [Cystobacter ferrugineus]